MNIKKFLEFIFELVFPLGFCKIGYFHKWYNDGFVPVKFVFDGLDRIDGTNFEKHYMRHCVKCNQRQWKYDMNSWYVVPKITEKERQTLLIDRIAQRTKELLSQEEVKS